MESSLATLGVLAEITIGFVALSAIVATLRVSFGEKLSAFQKLLVQFFTVGGMLTVSVLLVPLVFSEFWHEELTVARYSIFYILTVGGSYLVFYLRQRLRIKAPAPIASLFVMTGYAVVFILLGIVATGLYWEPSLAVVVACGFWGLFSSVIIFVAFLAEFIRPSE